MAAETTRPAFELPFEDKPSSEEPEPSFLVEAVFPQQQPQNGEAPVARR